MSQFSSYVPLSQTLPPTPELPPAVTTGYFNNNNVSLWYSVHGAPLRAEQSPVILLHGGKISSRWWGHQVAHLAAQNHTVIVTDTRAHGRSSDHLETPLSYDLFASDTVALLDHLDISSASFAGWSDGAITALTLAMNYGDRVERVFAFGASYRPDQVNMDGIKAMPFLLNLQSRMKSDYQMLSPTPDNFDTFLAKSNAMQRKYPLWDEDDFKRITTLAQNPITGCVVWIATGDSEEMIQRHVSAEMHGMINGSSLVVLPEVSHIGPMQDPDMFNAMLDCWLSRRSRPLAVK
ncbi:hypothetical protein FALBO_15965 [Fusarium albosuccineum]|uniref:AB hydrolase-1 domain-containing protein n=1 Tax=Fusarium albosuccineum TaxID=1237068 RepID=A0A8H4P1D3_9HYPO|nr:hypothetical protein FALBO_15965 [Fusarium albosuccineum]